MNKIITEKLYLIKQIENKFDEIIKAFNETTKEENVNKLIAEYEKNYTERQEEYKLTFTKNEPVEVEIDNIKYLLINTTYNCKLGQTYEWDGVYYDFLNKIKSKKIAFEIAMVEMINSEGFFFEYYAKTPELIPPEKYLVTHKELDYIFVYNTFDELKNAISKYYNEELSGEESQKILEDETSRKIIERLKQNITNSTTTSQLKETLRDFDKILYMNIDAYSIIPNDKNYTLSIKEIEDATKLLTIEQKKKLGIEA